MNPFARGQQQVGDWHPRQQRMSGDSISQWSQWCIAADVIRRPAGPNGSTESDNLGTRVANEHLRASYLGFCEQKGVRPADRSTFGKACTRMFGRKQRLVPKERNERRPPAYDVPTAEAWQERLDARFGIQKNPPESWAVGATPREEPVHCGGGVSISAGRVKR